MKEKKSAKVIVGTITPVFKSTVVQLYSYISNNTYWNRNVFPDMSGIFTVQVDTSVYQTIYVYVYDIEKTPAGYLPPRDTSLIIKKDTTRFAMSYSPAKEFIEGYVKDQNGDPVKNAHVLAWPNVYVNTLTDSTGYYKVGARTGNWEIYFAPPSTTEEYLRKKYYSYLYVQVGANQTVRQDYSFLKSNASISGRVKYGVDGVGGVPISAENDTMYNQTYTTANGNYILKVFKPNAGTSKYYVYAYVDYYSGYYIDTSYRSNISPGAVNVDFTMKKISGGVQGRITDGKTGEPIKNAYGYFSGPSYRSFSSDDSGYYKVRLLDGTYSLYVNANYYESYNDYNVIISGTILTKNVTLVRTGSFSGTVKDESGKPIPNVSIYAQDTLGYNYYYGNTDAFGKYIIGGLNTASYKAQANRSGYISQWYNKKSVMDSATAINVVKGFDTPNIDFELSLGGSISGLVKDKTGKGIPNINVYVLDTMSMYGVAYTQTNDSGKYIASGLFSGKYYVATYSNDYLDQWYNGASSYLTATKVPVIMYQNTPNINFTLSPGGIISGKVLDKLGNPIIGAEVEVLDTNYYYFQYGNTNDSGKYEIKKLSSGVKLYVTARAFGFSQRWYNNVTTPELATPIVLQTEEVRDNVNFTLPEAGKISGTVKNKAGTPLQYANINAYGKNGGYYYASSDQSGNYVFENLNAGKYIVYASQYGYIMQYFDHKSQYELADSVVVEEEKTTGNINFDLSTGGTITGTIKTVTGSPIAYASVYANSMNYGYYGSSDQSGGYTVNNITPGKYIVYSLSYGYATQWYDHKSSMLLADTIKVEEEKTVSNIDFDLKPSSSDSLVVKIIVDNLPDSLRFSQSNVGDNYIDYWWGMRFEVFSDSLSPIDDFETEIALIHAKNPGETEFTSDIINTTQHVLIRWYGGNGYNTRADVRVWRNPTEKNTIYLAVPKVWYEISGIGGITKFYGHSLYYGPNGQVSDVTPIGTGEVMVSDPKGDIPYSFVDITSAGWKVQIPMGVEENIAIPKEYALMQNFPNPFNPTTMIRYALPSYSKVSLKIYDVLGREVATVVNEEQPAGWREVRWDASSISSGIYFYRITALQKDGARAGSFVETKKLMFLK
jgi:protocatechuate 3,4-dioxygenase beta subunit